MSVRCPVCLRVYDTPPQHSYCGHEGPWLDEPCVDHDWDGNTCRRCGEKFGELREEQ